eukprot:Gb_32829 [translate_table: standard]
MVACTNNRKEDLLVVLAKAIHLKGSTIDDGSFALGPTADTSAMIISDLDVGGLDSYDKSIGPSQRFLGLTIRTANDSALGESNGNFLPLGETTVPTTSTSISKRK